MEPEGLLTCYRVYLPPVPILSQLNPHPPPPLPEDPSYYFLPTYVWVFKVVCFPQVSPQKTYMHLSSLP